MQLISLDEYKDFYSITDTKKDGQINEAITYAIGLAQSFIGRELATDTYSQTYDGGCSIIVLDNFPVETITSITEDGNATTDYTLYSEDGRIIKGTSLHNDLTTLAVFAGGLQGVTVNYTAGYTDSTGAIPVPDDLKLALLKLAKFLISDQKTSNPKVVRQTLHGEERQFSKLGAAVDVDLIPYDIRSILMQYR